MPQEKYRTAPGHFHTILKLSNIASLAVPLRVQMAAQDTNVCERRLNIEVQRMG